jgi:hypothetical protein
MALPAEGPAFESLERALAAVLSGRVRHGGAALAPFAIRYVVAAPDALDPLAAARLGQQVDMDLIQREGGLLLYRSAVALPQTAILAGEDAAAAVERTDLLARTALPGVGVAPLEREGSGWQGTTTGAGVALVTDEFDAGWTGSEAGTDVQPFPAFGWALGFPAASGRLSLRPDGLPWTLQLITLGILWAGALWVVRRRPSEAVSRASEVSRRGTGLPAATRRASPA